VSLEQFTKDLWEATRDLLRAELANSISPEDFDRQIPPWDKLPRKAREEKMRITRDETLRLIDRAGYEVRKKAP